ncbi:MAG: hypothetical protein MJZ24_10615 [Paludibacteraceae bacterium]|nr:hypothetical protein [Paludibacteraceae bacterium]
MATEISVSGNKKVSTLMKEFNEKFPYIRLGIFPISAKKTVASGGTIHGVDPDQTIAKVRSKVAPGDITITGSKLVSTIEKEFETIFGLYAQVCYTTAEGKRYYTSGSSDKMTLSAFNKQCEAEKCKKGEWK